MKESYIHILSLMEVHIRKGEIDQSREEAEAVLRKDPENVVGYILMTYHYYLTGQRDEALKWTEELLFKAPESEIALEVAAMLYKEYSSDQTTIREVIESGLRLYPENPFFHAQYASINKMTNVDQAITSYEEAIRLSPHNDGYLGDYAAYLYLIRDNKKAEKYEKLALQANPENTINLLNFADYSYELKKYKKAQYLIDEAMRIEPTNPRIRESYKKIYPTKNVLIRTFRDLNLFIGKFILSYPTHYIWAWVRRKVPFGLLIALIILLELAGLYALMGKGLFVMIGVYLLLLYSSSKWKKAILKKAGFTDIEEAKMVKKAEATQKAALKEMRQELARNSKQMKHRQDQLSDQELEAQLAQIWNTADIATIRETVVKESEQEKFTTPKATIIHEETPALEWPKEYSKWPIYTLVIGMVLSFMIRFVPGMIEDSQRPKPLPEETLGSIREFQETQNDDNAIAVVKQNLPAVTQFSQSLQDGQLIDSMSQFVSPNYETIIQENINQPLFQQLVKASIEKVINPKMGLPISYFLLINDDENIKAVVEVAGGKITHIYADGWSQSAEEKQKYQTLMEQLELEGKDLDEMMNN